MNTKFRERLTEFIVSVFALVVIVAVFGSIFVAFVTRWETVTLRETDSLILNNRHSSLLVFEYSAHSESGFTFVIKNSKEPGGRYEFQINNEECKNWQVERDMSQIDSSFVEAALRIDCEEGVLYISYSHLNWIGIPVI